MIENTIKDNRTKNELLKESSPTLSGSISKALADESVDNFTHEDYEFLKFHGIYQQDDRDVRQYGKKFIFMVRIKIPGGVISSEQYLTLDRLSKQYANNTLRITSRQSIQFHGVIKKNLAKTIKGINEALLTTLAACGDVARNVMAPPIPVSNPVYERVYQDAVKVSKSLLPQTPAYYDIWIEGKQIDLNSPEYSEFVDPLYGKTYLPRKFKVAFAIPPLNDIDVFTNCLGFVAIIENNSLVGYNLLAGGGMGRSHGNTQTYPRLADVIGFFSPEYVEDVARAVLFVFKEYGDRTNRKHARLKYVLAEKGAEWFKNEVEKIVGFKFAPPRSFQFTHQRDNFGWHKQSEDKWYLGLFVETGRIKDSETKKYKSALKKIAEEFSPQFRFTPSNSLYLANIDENLKGDVSRILKEHGIDVENQGTPIRKASMACVSLPTCGLGLAESERFMPSVVSQVEHLLEELGIPDEEITIRMTGCPNGCARPYTAEVAFVGKAPGKYQIYLGGNESNTRLNKLYKDNVKDTDLASELYPLLKRFCQERKEGERFGDWCARTLFTDQSQ
ncbi:MAG: NADPH-dependent assimilatory sulfite reductase hemoprotein subunit [Verrucomicrobiia bacterium]|jgi:sulfite reductase (NADPH) hemoprotein beta-component